MITVIVPVYNAAQTLSACVAALQTQTFADWEAIFVNDGSVDQSEQLLQSFAAADPRIRVLSQDNAGPAAARNAALQHAKGEWITFVDADDGIPAHYLEQLNAASRVEHCALVVCDVRRIIGNAVSAHHHNTAGVYSAAEYAAAVLARQIDYLTAHGAVAKMYRTDLLRQTGLQMDCRFRRGEDAIFSRRYAAMLPVDAVVSVTDAVWYDYYEQQSSLTTHYLDTIPASQGELARAAQALYAKTGHNPALQGTLDLEQYINFTWTVQTLQAAALPFGRTVAQLQAILKEEIITPEQLMRVKGGGRAWQLLAWLLRRRSAVGFWFWLKLRNL